MTDIVNLADHRQLVLLGSFDIYRQPDGQITAQMRYMANYAIDTRETIAERFEAAASWLRDGAASLDAQGKEFGQ